MEWWHSPKSWIPSCVVINAIMNGLWGYVQTNCFAEIHSFFHIFCLDRNHVNYPSICMLYSIFQTVVSWQSEPPTLTLGWWTHRHPAKDIKTPFSPSFRQWLYKHLFGLRGRRICWMFHLLRLLLCFWSSVCWTFFCAIEMKLLLSGSCYTRLQGMIWECFQHVWGIWVIHIQSCICRGCQRRGLY